MLLFDILNLNLKDINPNECKIHLACHNGVDNPLDIFLQGKFKKWQEGQNKKNFERKYIISLIQLDDPTKWLFAGIFIPKECKIVNEYTKYKYKTKEVEQLKNISGRLVVDFKRTSRQSYLNAENWIEDLKLHEIKPEKVAIEEFVGYNKVCISKQKLDIIISQSITSWKSALSNVSGIYLITDTNNGKLYVGSATGTNGIWQRWEEYSLNGHGGNIELKKLLKTKQTSYSNYFQYTILEIADTHASINDILQREIYWKQVLCSKEYGYNAN